MAHPNLQLWVYVVIMAALTYFSTMYFFGSPRGDGVQCVCPVPMTPAPSSTAPSPPSLKCDTSPLRPRSHPFGTLPSGIPRMNEYRYVLGNMDIFGKMDYFSRHWQELHRDTMTEYGKTWVKDPLHQWSRQWEYPYIFDKISAYMQKVGTGTPVKLLDAGSGTCFFPWFVLSRFPSIQYYTLDYDTRMGEYHHQINQRYPNPANRVHFTHSELQSIPKDDNTFDIVISISVLEHTKDYGQAARELTRVLKPGGLLAFTFDISIDGTYSIPIPTVVELLTHARTHPDLIELDDGAQSIPATIDSITQQVNSPDAVATTNMLAYQQELFPCCNWKVPLSFSCNVFFKACANGQTDCNKLKS